MLYILTLEVSLAQIFLHFLVYIFVKFVLNEKKREWIIAENTELLIQECFQTFYL